MNYGKVVEIFLTDGNPAGLQEIKIKNRTIMGLAVPRINLKKLLDYKKLYPGVYFLFGINEEPLIQNSVYVGETEDFKTRIRQHAEKEFWKNAVFFHGVDLNRAHIKYLEFQIYNELSRAGKVSLLNQNIPKEPKITIADKAVMEETKNDIFLILGTIGYPEMNKKTGIKTQVSGGSLEDFIFHIRYKSISAKMVPNSSGFTVLSGSQTFKVGGEYTSSLKGITTLQTQLIEKNNLVSKGDYYELMIDVLFNSPSAAAVFVRGRNTNGRTAWKTEKGRTYAEIENQIFGGKIK